MSNKPPVWEEVPDSLKEQYLMGNKISLNHWYINDTPVEGNSEHLIWDKNLTESFIKRFTANNIRQNLHGYEPYFNGALLILNALEKYNIKNKNIAIIGSQTPWVEAICINTGNKVTTIEYNVPQCTEWDILSYDNFVRSDKTYDVVLSYSSIEHSGLGRYGDPLDPDGDLKTIQAIKQHLNNDGFFLLGVPVSEDNEQLVWNAHRVYGPKRLAYVLDGFTMIDRIGDTDQPVLVFKIAESTRG